MHNVFSWTMLLTLIAAGVFGCQKPEIMPAQVQGQAQVPPEVLAKAGLQIYWDHKLPLREGENLTQAWVIDNFMYCLTSYENLFAVDAKNGVYKWSIHVTDHNERIFAPTHTNGMRLTEKVGDITSILEALPTEAYKQFNATVINTSSRVIVVDRNSGKIYRNFSFDGFAAINKGVVDSQRFYVASSDRLYVAVGLVQAINLWEKKVGYGEIIKVPMGLANGDLYMGTLSGTFRAILANDQGPKRWDIDLSSAINTPFHIDYRGAFVIAGDQLYALNAETGKRLWDPIQLNGIPAGPMLASETSLFQYSKGAGIFAVNLTNGQLRWQEPRGRKILGVMDGAVFILGKEGNLLVTDEITGKIRSITPLGGFSIYPQNTKTPGIFTAKKNGKIYCIRPKKAGQVTVDMLKPMP